MKLVIFGLAISSSWGNGHATIWRGLVKALAGAGHHVVFFERDVPYYAAHRDLTEIPGGKLILYAEWEEAAAMARAQLADADVGIVTSYCPDGIAASEAVLCSPALHVFYDMDTPVTLAALRSGRPLGYIGPRGLRDFDLVLSFTGGPAMQALHTELGARRVAPLYGCVDPAVHRPMPPMESHRAALSYLGTYSEDRMEILRRLFMEPAARLPQQRFLLGGSLYPDHFPWASNIYFIHHVPPARHPAFYCSSRLTLNVTRGAMAAMGHCPSGRLFEAAACGVPILSDGWDGLDAFFTPGAEILVASNTEQALGAISLSDAELARLSGAARERVLAEHTAECRTAALLERFHALRGTAAAAERVGGG